MELKSRDSIVIEPGVKLKRRRFSLNRGPIAKCQTFRGQIEISQISKEKTVSLLKH